MGDIIFKAAIKVFEKIINYAKNNLKFINDNNNVATFTIEFLANIFQHINSLNLKLQGDQKLICHFVSEVNCVYTNWNYF